MTKDARKQKELAKLRRMQARPDSRGSMAALIGLILIFHTDS